MSIAKQAANNVFWLLISQICVRGLTFIATIYLAKVLGVAGFGEYSLALAVAMYLWTIADVGVTGYGTREVARNTDKGEDLLNTLNSMRLIFSVVSFLLLGGVLFVLNIPDQTRWTFLAGGLYVVTYAISPDWVLRGIERMEYLALGNVVTGITFLGSIYFLVKFPTDTPVAALCRSLAFLGGSVAILIILKRKTGIGFSFEFHPFSWWNHLKESWPFAVNLGVAVAGKYIPLFFLGIWASTVELGLFSAAHRLVLMIIGAAVIIPSASYPILSRLYQVDKEKFRKTHRSFQKLVLCVGFPVAVTVSLLSHDIIEFLYGSSYLGASSVLEVMIWLVPVAFLRNDYGKSLRSVGYQQLSLFANGSGIILTIVLCFLLIPHHGNYGATLSMLGGELLALFLMGLIFTLKLYRLNPFDAYFFKVLGTTLLMGIIMNQTELSLLPKLFVGAVSYLFFSFLLGVIDKNDVKKIYRVVIP